MKNIFLPIILLTLFINSKAQLFEGKIVFLSKLENFTITNTLYIKGNNCRLESSFSNIETSGYTIIRNNQYYQINENMRQILKDTSDIFFEDNSDLVKLKKDKTVLGYNCSVFKNNLKSKNGKKEMYLFVANTLHTGIKMPFISVNGNIILKSILKDKDYSYVKEATEIKSMKLEDKLFELPDYTILEVDMANKAAPLMINSMHK